ncbi:DHA2 family efflux MFS transporter permease subunit [Silvibacterium dinghuense]|uniref:DHA2 family efflux MFS transporter permease subunit n=1 Tax=Silvibacterium dinghuense TaxID=1560006 RepID=A0A4Q1SAD3_9BACT|nr:DHA2 family efflux MFS transporter permease subunit [Silvibacterium dinghuense]RXS93875.1 DHA2 family efflux MFS transporter permease subunit [Silvibacterium dinghuense]GGH08403.1 EmrB/QacA family drug resistance transporter [Silvibacterium dinghuense]
MSAAVESGNRLWLIAGAVILAPFMEVLDTSIANVALPYMAGSLSASEDEAIWVLTSYLVANAVVLPMSGWLSGRLGRKRFYLLSVAMFTASSLLCGMAPTLGLLILFRIIQGLGGGGLQPSTQAILADTFPKERLAAAFTLYSVVIVLAPTLGPVLGGWLSDHWGWRWIFFLNVPCGAAAYLLNRALQPEANLPHAAQAHAEHCESQARNTDWSGLAGIALGLGCLEFVLDRGERLDWFGSRAITVAAIVSAVALAWLVYHELFRAKAPVLQLHMLRNRNFALANGIVFSTYFARYASTALLPEFTHDMLGYTATDSGLVLSPGSLSLLLFLPLTTWLMKRVDARALIFGGLMLTGYAFWRLSGIELGIDYATIVRLRILESVAVGLFLTPLSVLAFSRLASGKNDAAASLYGLSRNLGSAIGISVVNTMLVRRAQVHASYLSAQVTATSLPALDAVQSTSAHLTTLGGDAPAQAGMRALGAMYHELGRQAEMLCYVDCFHLLMGISLAAAPFALLFAVKKRA